jgi:hypothetical protein
MIFLKTFNEKLGIDDNVLTLADELYDKLKNKSIIETTFNGKKLVVMIYPEYTLNGKFSHMIGANGLYYQIFLSKLDKPTLVHEIKHMFRNSKVSGRGRKDFIPTKSEELSAKYNTVFKDDDYKEFFLDVIYFTDKDEFESFYHEIYFNLKEELANVEESERQDYISDYIKNQQVYFWNKYLHDNKININTLFKTEKDFNFFMNELEKRLFDSKWYHNKKYYKVFTDIKRLFDNEDYSEFGKKLSFSIHKNANKNYRKLMRIYSLF